jgi:hypothetical protein
MVNLGDFSQNYICFYKFTNPFYFGHQKRKENTDLEGKKRSSAVHREVGKMHPKLPDLEGKKEFRVHYI